MCMACILAGCGQGWSDPASPAFPISELNPRWFSFQGEQTAGPVSGLCYRQDTQTLLVYDDYAGLLRVYIDSGIMESIYSPGIQAALQFSGDCSRLMGSTRTERKADRFGVEHEYIYDVRIWDVSTGEEVACYGDCDQNNRNPIEIGAALDPLGDSPIIYSEASYVFLGDFPLNKIKMIHEPDETSPNIDKIVFSPNSIRFVMAYLEGGVYVGNDVLYGTRRIERNDPDHRAAVTALAMDPTEHFVARIRDDRLMVWKFGVFYKKVLIDTALEGESLLTFDREGRYLLVGGNDHIQVWDLDLKEITAEIPAVGITAMILSQDNHLLIWGDEHGGVYMLGDANADN